MKFTLPTDQRMKERTDRHSPHEVEKKKKKKKKKKKDEDQDREL